MTTIDLSIVPRTIIVFRILIILMMLTLSSSCSNSEDDPNFQLYESTIPVSPVPTKYSTLVSDLILENHNETPTEQLTVTAKGTHTPPDNTELENPASFIPTSPIHYQICSPLESEEINELWEIVSDPYSPPPMSREERHHGVDFSYYRRGDRLSIEGEGIQSILPGIVVAKVVDRLPYGNMVIIETHAGILPTQIRESLKIDEGMSLYVLYAHMNEEPEVELGDRIECGQNLGDVGLTGYNIVNSHLHLETRVGVEGAMFSSMVFYDTSASVEEMDNYRRWRTSGEFTHFDPMRLFQLYLGLLDEDK